MNEKQIIKKLNEKTVFNIQEMQRILNSSREYTKLVLNRLVNRESIKRIKKNSYTLQDDPVVISTNIVYPSYLSFWSASSYKGYTEQILNTIQIATTKKLNNLTFQNQKIEFVKIKSPFGYEKIKTKYGELFLALDEKLIIDSLEHQKRMGNFDEIEKIIENSKIDKLKMVDFLKRNKNQSTVKRVGYLLEEIKNMDLSKKFTLDKNYIKLNKLSNKSSKINSKWKVKI
jgi:predicted transcriptional regulator of viral defense system